MDSAFGNLSLRSAFSRWRCIITTNDWCNYIIQYALFSSHLIISELRSCSSWYHSLRNTPFSSVITNYLKLTNYSPALLIKCDFEPKCLAPSMKPCGVWYLIVYTLWLWNAARMCVRNRVVLRKYRFCLWNKSLCVWTREVVYVQGNLCMCKGICVCGI